MYATLFGALIHQFTQFLYPGQQGNADQPSLTSTKSQYTTNILIIIFAIP